MGVLDHEAGRLTRSRKIDHNAIEPEDVFVFRVFGTAPSSATTHPPKSKLVKKAITTPSPQLAAVLNNADEEDEENA